MSQRFENTRRTFLAGAALGALGTVVPSGRAGATQEAPLDPEVTFDCWAVEVDDDDGAYGVRVDYRDGSVVEVPVDVPDRLGSPGRVVESVTFSTSDGDTTTTITNPVDDCDPGPRSTTFTSGSVTVRPGEFRHVDVVPDSVISRVVLHFVDGTTETKMNYEHDPPRTVADEFRGTGEHASKTIEAVEIDYDLAYSHHYLRNPQVHQHLLGRQTCRERTVEVVGASEGAVEYEFTVDGPVSAASLTERVGGGGNDDVTDNGDGTWTVSGYTGNPGYGDAFVVNGEITDFAQTGGDGDYVLREHECRIVRDASADADMLSVVATEEGEVTYEFTVDGDAYPVTNVGEKLSAEPDDEITDNGDGTVTVSGYTGNQGYGDTFAVAGSVEAFERTGGDADFRILYRGREVTPDELSGSQ